MRFLLPIFLLFLGAMLVTPLIRTASMWATSGTPDATALSTDIGSLIQGGIGALLLIVGLVILVIRLSRRNTVRPS
ncbi:MAG: hypothetical protein IPG74_13935 [Flavobacteriales bacterium]|nr:hypothetical protein [Flavobacteriales bacterium]